MNLAVGATELELGDDHRKAGVGRYVLRVLETLLWDHPELNLTVFTRPETVVPEKWRERPDATFLPTWAKTRSYELVGRELQAAKGGYDAWWALGGRVPRTPLPSGGPRVSMVHDLFFLTEPDTYSDGDRRIHATKALAVARHADLIVTNSEHTRSEVIARLGRTPESVFAAPLGLGNLGDPVPRSEVDRELLASLGATGRYVFSLSTLEPRKNFPRLLQAWAIAAQEPDLADVTLVIGGGKGWETADLNAEIARLGLNGRVRFAGYVPDAAVPHLFAGCEAFVLPSLIEGFGITVLEAMHYGAGVACAATGSLPEVAGRLALFFDPFRPEEIAAATLALVRESPESRAARVAAGFERAREFSWPRNVRTVLDRIAAYRR